MMRTDYSTGVLYTEYSTLCAHTTLMSLWRYQACEREPRRPSVGVDDAGNREYWLEHSDPLLNAILPGTGVSLVVNFAAPWAAGRSLVASAALPQVCVIGPVTQARILRVGPRVQAVGAVVPPVLTMNLFGVPASELVDRVVPLEDLWTPGEADHLSEAMSLLPSRRRVEALRGELMARMDRGAGGGGIEHLAFRLMMQRRGRLWIDDLAKRQGLTRQQLARRFSAATGLNPKLFARITRFQALIQALLSTDVSEWVSVAPAVGFYDQAHMINEFRAFAGSPPTVFFQPHDEQRPSATIHRRGRPSEWVATATT
jgi:AraC-like DNA-binding protein